MKYDEFSERLRKLKESYKMSTGRDLTTVDELEKYLDKLLAKPKKKGARSLRGLSL